MFIRPPRVEKSYQHLLRTHSCIACDICGLSASLTDNRAHRLNSNLRRHGRIWRCPSFPINSCKWLNGCGWRCRWGSSFWLLVTELGVDRLAIMLPPRFPWLTPRQPRPRQRHQRRAVVLRVPTFGARSGFFSCAERSLRMVQ